MVIDNNTYEIIKGQENFNEEEFKKLYTDYFKDYDYILGDYAYDKLRLKGFCNKDNKIFKKINDYTKIDEYIKEDCAYGCKYFILRRKKNGN